MQKPSYTSHKQNHYPQDQQPFFQQLADLTPGMLYVLDLEEREIIYINQSVEKILGHTARYVYEMGHAIFKEVLHPADYERRMAHIEACKSLVEEEVKTIDVRLKVASGDWCWFRVRDKAYRRDEQGKVVQILGTFQDIDEEKAAVEKLQEEHRRLADAQALVQLGSFERPLPGDILFCSDEFFRIHGLEPQPEGIKLAAFILLLHPEDRAAYWAAILHTHATGEPLNIINRLVRPDGSIRHIHRRANIFYNAKREPVRIYGTVQDITEQVLAQRKIKENEILLRQGEQVARTGSYEIDAATRNVRFSDGLYHIFGYKPEAVTKTLDWIDSISHPDDVIISRKKIERASIDKKPYTYIRRICREDGEARTLEVHGRVLCDAEGIVHKYIGLVQDITERIKAEEERKKNETLLRSTETVAGTGSYEADLIKNKFHFSDGLFRLFGQEPGDFVPSLDWIDSQSHPDDIPVVRKILEQAADDKKAYTYTRRIYRKDGEMRILEVHGKVICDAEGNAIKLIGLVQDITERKQTEETLQQMLNGSISAITILQSVRDEKGKIIDFVFKGANKAAEALNQMSKEEMIDRRLLELFPVVKDEFFDTYVKVVETGEPMRVQRFYPHEHFDHWFDVSAVKNGDGFIMTFHDVSEQKKAEQELLRLRDELAQQATDKYKKIINSMDECFCVVELIFSEAMNCVDYRIIDTNPMFEKQTGIKNPLGRTISDLIPNLEQSWKEIFDKVALSGEPIELEDYSTLMGRWYEVYAFRVDAPEEHHVAMMFSDITERKKAEEQLRGFNQLLEQQIAERTQALAENAYFIRQVANTTPDIIFVYDLEQMRLQYINRDTEPLKGKIQQDLKVMESESLFSLLHPEDRQAANAYRESFRGATDEEEKQVDFRVQDAMGHWKWFHCRGRVFKRDAAGKVQQFLSIMRNVTEERYMQQALLEAEKLSVKGQMARTIAHEVRGPLVNVKLALEMLQKEQSETERPRTEIFHEIISKSTNRIEGFITELLNLSKNKNSTFDRCKLKDIVEEAIFMAEDRLFLHSVTVEKQYDENCLVKAEPERLKIAILNLIHNAVEAMDAGKGILKLIIRKDIGYITLLVQDNGCGMNKEQLSKLFDAYYTNKPFGLGVGLANVRAILQNHDARIKVESKPGEGTTFSLFFDEVEQ